MLRRAVADDNAAILEFMRTQSMRAGIAFRFERSPDFFALHTAHNPDNVTWIVTQGDQVVATTSVVCRPAYVDRAVRSVAYLADLRQAGGRHLAGVWRKVALFVLREAQRERGATLTYCSILSDNRIARSSILSSRLGDQLKFHRLRGYKTVTLVGRMPWMRRRATGIEISRGSEGDSEALRRFVDGQSQSQQFSVVFDAKTWRHRLDSWVNFSIESFLIARDRERRIVGCLAPWDSSPINRVVVDSLPAPAELLRRSVNAASMLTRRPKIPVGPNTYIPDVALTHVFIANRDAMVFSALVDAAYDQQIAARRCATLSLCLYDGDPMWAGLKRSVYSSLPMDVYWAPLGGNVDAVRRSDLWPGFEPYLV